jgi:death-on-curing protein
VIDFETTLKIHNLLIDEFGGTRGIRDHSLLDSALNRPFQTFDGELLYPTLIDQSAAIIESIVKNHPFHDGNKRTGYTLMRLHLLNNGLDINASEDDKYDFVISIASGRIDFDQIKQWIENNLEKNEG